MRYGSLFSGVGGFDLGLDRAGFECAWQVEIDQQALQVLRRHWPDVPKYEDVTNVGRSELARVDLICGGFPCQDLSVAGKREGLGGERSGLFYEFMRIADELAPRWLLIENVPGLLSSWSGDSPSSLGVDPGPGREMVLEERSDMDIVARRVAELGYWWTYASLDTQYFDPPQRRERIFIIGHLGGPSPREVLLEPESLPWNPPPSREARQRAARATAPSLTGSGRGVSRVGESRGQDPIVAHPILSREGKGPASSVDIDSGNIVAHTLRAEGFDASEDGTGRGTPLVADTLVAGGREMPPHGLGDGKNVVTFVERGRAKGRTVESRTDGTVNALMTPNGGRGGTGPADGVVAPCLRSNQYNNSDPGMEAQMFAPTPIPRRLTPRECERLQGFPDDHTAWGVDAGGERVDMADGPRYRMLGNAVSVPVAEWIARRIAEAT